MNQGRQAQHNAKEQSVAEADVTLGDLWVRGKPLTITGPVTMTGDDGTEREEERSVDVWIRKMNPVEQEEAFRKGRAKRAVALSAARNKESDEYLACLCDAYDMGPPNAIAEFLVGMVIGEHAMKIEAELAGEGEWAEESYLEGLRDAWFGDKDAGVPGLVEKWLEDPDDPDAARVFAEMERFKNLVNERLEQTKAELRAQWEQLDDEELYHKAAEKLAEAAAADAFSLEYWRTEIHIATRRADDHKKLYFTNRSQVDELQPETFTQLRDAFRLLEVPLITGKDSPPDPDSSTPSGPSEKAETGERSGLATASR